MRWPSGRSAKVELQDFNLRRERDPMTEERLVLAELLEKGLPHRAVMSRAPALLTAILAVSRTMHAASLSPSLIK